MTDPRIARCLERAEAAQGHPRECYAAMAYHFARAAGDEEGMRRAIELGAARYRRAALVYARTEKETMQLTFWEAA